MAATRYPGAVWKPLQAGNYTPGGVNRPPRGMVLHIAEGSSQSGVWNWQNSQRDVSSYFIVGKDGTIWQAVDLNDKAWTQSAGNSDWIGIENCGYHTEALTAAQVEANAHLFAWLHTEHGVPLQATDDPNGHGLGWHGMGGKAWGGHYGCPGDQIRNQRQQIINRAHQLVTPPPPPAPITQENPNVKLMRGDSTPEVWLVGATGKPVHLTGDAPGVPGTYGPWLMWCVAHVPGSVDPATNREWVVPQRQIDAITR
jgi:hypothetical protein